MYAFFKRFFISKSNVSLIKNDMYKIKVKDWRKIPLKNLEFILSQSEIKLNYTIQNSDKITNKFYSILLLLIGLFTASVGYFSSEYSCVLSHDNKYFIDLVFLVILFIEILFFIKYTSPRLFHGNGRFPHELSNKENLQTSESINEDEQYKSLLIGEINNIESKLIYNTNQNQNRLSCLKKLIYSIVIFSLIYLTLRQLVFVL